MKYHGQPVRRQWKREIWNTIGTSENDLGLEGTYEGAGAGGEASEEIGWSEKE